MKKRDYKLFIKDIVTRLPDYAVAQIVDNILDNAFYWLSTKTQKHGRKILIHFDENKNTMLITNNGPALTPNIKKNLFILPFVTAKQHGRGLGMYITSEILNMYGGRINVESPEEDKRVMSIGFLIYFPSKK